MMCLKSSRPNRQAITVEPKCSANVRPNELRRLGKVRLCACTCAGVDATEVFVRDTKPIWVDALNADAMWESPSSVLTANSSDAQADSVAQTSTPHSPPRPAVHRRTPSAMANMASIGLKPLIVNTFSRSQIYTYLPKNKHLTPKIIVFNPRIFHLHPQIIMGNCLPPVPTA